MYSRMFCLCKNWCGGSGRVAVVNCVFRACEGKAEVVVSYYYCRLFRVVVWALARVKFL